MKKKLFYCFGILFLLNLSLVSSHFVCGIVNNSDDNVSASWYNVKLFYPENENNYADCEVSPQDNKYCCDAEAIPPEGSWNIGKIVSAKVLDFDLGYAAGPVFTTTTGEGYDVMPEMKLKKVINVYNPHKRVIVSNDASVLLNLSFLEPYNHVELEKMNNRIVLCENCSNYDDNFSFDFGMNYIKIHASDNNDVFAESKNFAIITDYKFDRVIDCKKCKNNWVKSSSIVNMTLNLVLSDEVENFLLKEYVPVSWEILNLGGGEIKSFNDDYNVISWNVSGKNISKKYSVKAPKTNIMRYQDFLFKSELEDFDLGNSTIFVYRFFRFWKMYHKFSFDFENLGNFIKIDSNHPLVFNSDDGFIKAGVFPKKSFNKATFKLFESNLASPRYRIKLIKSYTLKTNLKKKDVSKIYLEFKINKSFVTDKNHLEFFKTDSLQWKEFKPLFLKEDDKYFYYSFKSDFFNKIWIGEYKSNFFSMFFSRFSFR